ncbi:MAG TPA: thioesterase domain-containing protein [Acetobacteraceae bacterium]|nr:thioesterase domain-containing protein [Acetobacteraceae bacterium]
MSDPGACMPARAEEIENEVRRIWERLLQYSPAHPDDDFFDAGGDSLLVAAFCTEIERRLGQMLPFPVLYDMPTLGGVTQLLAKGQAPRFSPLVPLNQGTGGPPLFVLPGVGGSVMDFAAVGPLISGDRAVIGVQAKGMDGFEKPLDRIESMADYALATIRQVAPHGPYLFVGYSAGGLVALEMARLVQEAGESVRLLAFIDTYPHSGYWPRTARIGVRARRILHLAGALSNALRQAPWAEVASYVGMRLGLAGKRPWARASSEWNPYDPSTTPESVRRIHEAGLIAIQRYEPRGYDGPVAFIRATSKSFYVPGNPVRQWNRLIGSLTVQDVPGTHVEILSRHATRLAASLSSLIADPAHQGMEQVRTIESAMF